MHYLENGAVVQETSMEVENVSASEGAVVNIDSGSQILIEGITAVGVESIRGPIISANGA